MGFGGGQDREAWVAGRERPAWRQKGAEAVSDRAAPNLTAEHEGPSPVSASPPPDRKASWPPTFAESSAAYLAGYYRLLGSVARLLRLRSLAEGFVMLADFESARAAGLREARLR